MLTPIRPSLSYLCHTTAGPLRRAIAGALLAIFTAKISADRVDVENRFPPRSVMSVSYIGYTKSG